MGGPRRFSCVRDDHPKTCRNSSLTPLHLKSSYAARQGPDALARACGEREGRLRRVSQAADALRRVHGIRGHPGVSRHRHQQSAKPAAGAVEAHRRPRLTTSSSTAPRAKWGCYVIEDAWLPARCNPEKHMYEEILFRRRRPRQRRKSGWTNDAEESMSSNGRRARCSRFPMNAMAPHRQRLLRPGALLLGGTTAPVVHESP